MKEVVIYTDGACKGNPGVGGWGALLQYGERERRLHGGDAETTNNRMELTAAIRALQALTEPCTVALYTDSSYVQQGISNWMADWKRRGWNARPWSARSDCRCCRRLVASGRHDSASRP